MIKINIKTVILSSILVAIAIYIVIKISMPTEIVSVHTEAFGEDVLGQYIVVKNPPLTASRMISWWNNNKGIIEKNYGIPKESSSNGTYTVIVFDLDNGYEEYREGSFLDFSNPEPFCFDDIKSTKNCVDKKNIVMEVSKAFNGDVIFYIDNKSYKNGKTVY